MIERLRHHEIDKEWWDQRSLACANRMWYIQSWVLDLTSPGWDALVDRTSGAIMPLTWRRKFYLKYLFQPYGTQQQGVFAPDYSRSLGEAFLRAIPTEFRLIDIALNEAMTQIEIDGSVTSPLDQQVLPLDRPIDAIRRAYSKGHIRNLKKIDPALQIINDITASEFTHLFIHTTAKRFKTGTPSDHSMMELVIEKAIRLGQCKVYGIRRGGTLIAAASFMEWEGRRILYKSAANAQAQELKAMFRIIDHYIGLHAGSGELLDLAGSNTASVARFNAGFGAQRKVYLRLKRNTLPPPFKWFK